MYPQNEKKHKSIIPSTKFSMLVDAPLIAYYLVTTSHIFNHTTSYIYIIIALVRKRAHRMVPKL